MKKASSSFSLRAIFAGAFLLGACNAVLGIEELPNDRKSEASAGTTSGGDSGLGGGGGAGGASGLGGTAGAPSCDPASCTQAGAECGLLPAGCSCGVCAQPKVCMSNKCVCNPATCASLGADCGNLPDGCGGTLDCGTCSNASDFCGGNGPNQCGPNPCTPTSCAAEGKNCDSIPDNCGETLNCGSCPTGQLCSSNVCLKDIGQTCASDSECLNSHCIDDHCCGDSSCLGTCVTCDPTKNGGTIGLCLPILKGQDPDNECPGTCDGLGKCS